MIQNLNPFNVQPLHPARQSAMLKSLADDMKVNGWDGRPLLVIASGGEFIAWTGSHRIAAARKARLESIPCYVLSEDAIRDGDNDARFGHVDDSDRLKMVRKSGDPAAIHLMWQEGRL